MTVDDKRTRAKNIVCKQTFNGVFTLPDTDTDTDNDTDTNKMSSQPNCISVGVCVAAGQCEHLTQFYTTHFLSVSVSGSVNTPLDVSKQHKKEMI